MVKKLTANAGDIEVRLDQEDPCRKVWQPIPVFLPGEFNGQKSLVGYSPQGHKELGMTEVTYHTLYICLTSKSDFNLLGIPKTVSGDRL